MTANSPNQPTATRRLDPKVERMDARAWRG
jgi:hypothetical protein